MCSRQSQSLRKCKCRKKYQSILTPCVVIVMAPGPRDPWVLWTFSLSVVSSVYLRVFPPHGLLGPAGCGRVTDERSPSVWSCCSAIYSSSCSCTALVKPRFLSARGEISQHWRRNPHLNSHYSARCLENSPRPHPSRFLVFPRLATPPPVLLSKLRLSNGLLSP